MKVNRLSVAIVVVLLMGAGQTLAQFKLYENGHDDYKSGDYSGAISNFTEFLSKPTHDRAMDPEVRYLLALSYYKIKDYKNAVENFQEALLLNYPNKGNMYWFMAKCHDNLKQYDDAVEDYTNSIRELGADSQTKSKLYYERGQIKAKAGKLSPALDDFKASLATNPQNADAKKEVDALEKQGVVASRTTPADTQTRPQTPGNSANANTGKTPGGEKKEAPPVVKREDSKKEESRTGDVASNEPSSSGEIAAEDIVAARLRKAGKKESDQSTTTPPQSNPQKTQMANNQPTTTPQNSTVITGSDKTSSAALVNSLADAYKEERRFALVIGNSKYPQSIGVLKNPVNDATDIAKELEKSNFDVQLLTDATYGQMRAAMLKFKEKVDAGEKDKTVALFYYAGHGLAHEDENYLVPVDAMIEYEDDISRYCFGVQRMVLANMERSNSRMNIVILDACRNNPFPALTRSAGQQGLGEMRRARGSFIAYATAPGSVASDGTGRNGLYTQELLKAMRKPGLTIEQVFKEVRAGVSRMSGDKQNTWDSSNIIGEFYFKF
jgi:tetratricopeptide (TPR) repeat protein